MRVFGSPTTWPEQDLIGVSERLEPDLVLAAYREGVFPMPLPEWDEIGWWSPLDRGVLLPGALRVRRSLRKAAKRYHCTVDADLPGVLAGCADPSRPHGWIDAAVVDVYTDLHRRGIVHSVEVRDDAERLVGGLYGVALGGLFAGESMFHDPEHGRDASKVALMHLVDLLSVDGRDWLIDTQWLTPHLATLGVVEIGRDDYLRRLGIALTQPDAIFT